MRDMTDPVFHKTEQGHDEIPRSSVSGQRRDRGNVFGMYLDPSSKSPQPHGRKPLAPALAASHKVTSHEGARSGRMDNSGTPRSARSSIPLEPALLRTRRTTASNSRL